MDTLKAPHDTPSVITVRISNPGNQAYSDSNKPAYRVIDLFAGAGGMTLGFTRVGGSIFSPVWANDFDKNAVATYNANFGQHSKVGDILDILQDPFTEIPQADVVIGGPPCQGFSLLNRNRLNDPRKQLWRPYLDVVKKSGASVFVMENVPQILGSEEHIEISRAAEELGFMLTYEKLLAADFGVPQLRWRAFIIGCNFADPAFIFPPKKTHGSPSEASSIFSEVKPWRTVRDAISDLPSPEGTEIRDEPPPLNLHFGRTPTPTSIARYKIVSEEGMNRFDLQRLAPEITPDCWIRKTKGGTDLFGRLWWDRPAFTIRTEFYKPEKGRYLHPSQHRPLTHREAARLQTFPDDFIFTGSKIQIAKQIGNAVPPVLAEHIAESVKALLMLRKKTAL